MLHVEVQVYRIHYGRLMMGSMAADGDLFGRGWDVKSWREG